MHYFGSRRIKVAEPLILTDTNGDSWAFKGEELPPPLTIKESSKEAITWTWYLFVILIIAGVLTGIFGTYLANFINFFL